MKTTEEGNKLIDAFMIVGLMEDKPKNYKHSSSFGKNYFKNLKYHSSWDWLMPVVEKIGEKDFRGADRLKENIMLQLWEVNIISAWNAVVEFIDRYNTQNK